MADMGVLICARCNSVNEVGVPRWIAVHCQAKLTTEYATSACLVDVLVTVRYCERHPYLGTCPASTLSSDRQILSFFQPRNCLR